MGWRRWTLHSMLSSRFVFHLGESESAREACALQHALATGPMTAPTSGASG